MLGDLLEVLELFGAIYVLWYTSGVPLYHHLELPFESVAVCHLLH